MEITHEDGTTGVLWAADSGALYQGRVHMEEGWRFFDEQTYEMVCSERVSHSPDLEVYYGQDGLAAAGRLWLDETLYEADARTGNLKQVLFGWQAPRSYHAMKQRKEALEQKKAQWEEQGVWEEFSADPQMQDCQGELQEIEKYWPYMQSDPVYVLYNPHSGEHVYTPRLAERDNLIACGWKYENICWGSVRNVYQPVYRLYLPSSGDHHYTTDQREVQYLSSIGWKDEGVVFYGAGSQMLPVYRLYNPNARIGAHHFTLSENERDFLVKSGWRDEGTAFYTSMPYSLSSEVRGGKEGTAAYDGDDQPLTGRIQIQGTRFFDPEDHGLMAVSRFAQIPEAEGSQRLVTAYFDEEGKMAAGERQFEDGWRYFKSPSGEMARNEFVQYGSPKKTCWFDEQGRRAAGRVVIDGKTYLFDEKSGAMLPDLESLLQKAAASISARALPSEKYALALRICSTGQAVFWNNGPQQSASVMKLFVMGAIYENFETYCARYGRSWIESSLHSMITVSSNEAWKNLVAVLGNGSYETGLGVLRRWNQSKGYNETWMTNVPYGNYTSVKDASQILDDIEKGKLRHAGAMKALIQAQAVPGRLLAGIPAGVKTGNKPGWVYNAENDTVIVYSPAGTYIITLLSDNLQNTLNARSIMKDISAMVYQWMQENL